MAENTESPLPNQDHHSEFSINGSTVRLNELKPTPPDGLSHSASLFRTVCGTTLSTMNNDKFLDAIRLHLEFYFWQCSPNWLKKKDELKEKYTLALSSSDEGLARSIEIYNFGNSLSVEQLQEIQDSFQLFAANFGINSIGIDSLLIDNQDRQPNSKVSHLSEEDYESERKKRGGSFLMRGAEYPPARAIALYPVSVQSNRSDPYDPNISLSTLSGTILHELTHCDPEFDLDESEFMRLVGWKFQNGRFEYVGDPKRRFPTVYAKVQPNDHLAESVVALLSGREIEEDVSEFIKKRRRPPHSLTTAITKSDNPQFPKPPEEIGYYYRDVYANNFRAANKLTPEVE